MRDEKAWIAVSATLADEPDEEDNEWTAGDYTTIPRGMIDSIEVHTAAGWQPYKRGKRREP